MSTLVYVRDADLRKVQEFQAACIRHGRNFSYRNPGHFDKTELLVAHVLVDARYPHIAEAYERRGVRSHLIDFKNLEIFTIDDFLGLLDPLPNPGLPNLPTEGDTQTRGGGEETSPQVFPPPESPDPSPADEAVEEIVEDDPEIETPAAESISPAPDVSSPRSRRRNVRRVPTT
jgi:hypothetical protein